MSLSQHYKEILSALPSRPGVYRFIDSSGNILYVGKAGNLKKRVSSYFSGNQSGKTNALLRKAERLEHTIVDNESDALLLENNLIKKHQPRYNILLKDDKTFPWICIKKEPFPRVYSTRNVVNDGSLYYGPYTSGLMVKTIIGLLRQLFQLRTCNYKLTEENIESGKLKVCLEYHLGNCKAPCIGLQNEKEYQETILQVREILKGNVSAVIEHLKKLMTQFSKELRFEEAQKIKDKIEILSRYRSKSTIVTTTIKNVDVFGFTADSGNAYISFLKVSHGAIVQAFTLEMKSRITEENETLLGTGITEIRQKVNSDSGEIIVPFYPDILSEKLRYTVPEIGDKRKLLDLATRNAIYYKLEQKKRKQGKSATERTGKYLEKVKNDLHMSELPLHIECFDNSNIMGSNPVAACVVFLKGKPARKEYRHFNVKTVKGPDDFSSMEEIVFRRYRRLLEEAKTLPQLIVIDGGKGQLSSAMKSLEKLGLNDRIAIIGIAKKLEEIYFPGDSIPIYLDKNSYTLKLIQQIRNEAHRFGINFHRDKRSAEMIRSNLDTIKGIGPQTKQLLLKNFGTVDKIGKASITDLENLIGPAKAKIIYEYFKNQPELIPGKD
jgi:excinuclease ABC subunit C